jgi:hypothetical protein
MIREVGLLQKEKAARRTALFHFCQAQGIEFRIPVSDEIGISPDMPHCCDV